MPFSLVPFLLLVIPLLEIAVFVMVGGAIGVLPTLALVVVTAIAGSILLRVQGFGVVDRIRRTMDAGRMPGRELVHGVMILVAGVLLLTPGFVTDTLGFLLFVPALRDMAWALLRDRIVVVAAPGPHGRTGAGPGTGTGTG
ncbi:FxsA family protein, partial [Aquibium sp. A9E412]|uniref:FxsA family protein n=1 Tax=Aquibium sp. A9E412 TaxID=2976767 RepID=UPI0025B19527